MLILLSNAVAFFLTIACILLLKPLALRVGLVDEPGGRKQHQGEIPLVGGIAMFLSFIAALLLLPVSLHEYRSFFAAYALLAVIGILDDFHELSARPRFAAQIFAMLLMCCWGKVQLQNLGNLLFLGDIQLNNWAIPFTVFAGVGIINAVNMSDGLDGLAGSLAIIELGFLTWLANQAGLFTSSYVMIALICVLAGFLCFNIRFPGRRHALVFMGDSGSMPLGFILVWFLTHLSQGEQAVAKPVIMLWIMAVPLFDMVGVMLRRFFEGKSPLSADRDHLHHLLLALGYTQNQTMLILCCFAVLFGVAGIGGQQLGLADGQMFLGFLLFFIMYLLSSIYWWKKLKKGKR